MKTQFQEPSAVLERLDASPGYRADADVRAWLETTGDRLVAALVRGVERNDPVVRYATPEGWHAYFEGLGAKLPLRQGDTTISGDTALAVVEGLIDRAVHASHPRFFNQNWAGADPISVVGDWLTALLNTTAATYEMAPVFTLMDNELLARMARLIGLGDGSPAAQLQAGAHGLFTPGGATSNLYALHLARAFHDPEALRGGMGRKPLVALTSAQSHYSFVKAAMMTGLGRDNLIEVPCDEAGQMRVDALEDTLRRVRADGKTPFFINATAGTTVTGAFDDIDAIATVAEREACWLHVDACFGGSVAFSARHQPRLKGAERAQSVAWNPHKMMGITQQCSVLLLENPGLLRQAFASGASYIFQPDKNDAENDLGDLTLQCGRRADGLKLWLTWKLRGEAWFEHRIDHALELAEVLEAKVEAHPAFVAAHPRTFVNVGFWWLPEDLRGRTPPWTKAEAARLHALAPAIKNAMQREGSAMLGYQPLEDRPNFFRLLVMSPDVREADLDETLAIIDRLGRARS